MTVVTLFSSTLGDIPADIKTALSLGRALSFTEAYSDTAVALTATPAAGAMGISRTTGTSFGLIGETTAANALTDRAMWELLLPDTYANGSNIPVTVNCNYTGAGTVTAANTTMAVAAYTEVNGVETAIAGITAAQRMTAVPANLVFTIPGAGLVAGQKIVIELTMLVTTSAGAATGRVNNVSYVA